MTPDQKVALWIAALTALPTIVFTGSVAYWNWRRDQERVIVKKAPTHWNTLDGSRTAATLCGVGIAVTNLSLFPVRIAGLGFLFDGKTSFPLETGEEGPVEIASHARLVVYASDSEWQRLVAVLGNCGRVNEWGFVAVAITETERRFASNRLSVQFMRPLRALRGWTTRLTARNSR